MTKFLTTILLCCSLTPSLYALKTNKKYKKTTAYIHTLALPLTTIIQGASSLPAGIAGGFVGTVTTQEAKKNRIPHGIFYGLMGTVQSLFSLIALPVIMPIQCIRIAQGKEILVNDKDSVFWTYYAGRDSYDEGENRRKETPESLAQKDRERWQEIFYPTLVLNHKS